MDTQTLENLSNCYLILKYNYFKYIEQFLLSSIPEVPCHLLKDKKLLSYQLLKKGILPKRPSALTCPLPHSSKINKGIYLIIVQIRKGHYMSMRGTADDLGSPTLMLRIRITEF